MTKHAENDREEMACEVFDDIPPKEKLESMSNLSLAKLQEQFSSDKACLVIIQNEWRRREQLEQHKLNEKIIEKQHLLNLEISRIQSKISCRAMWLGFAGTILGAVIAASVTYYASEHSVPPKAKYQEEHQAVDPTRTPQLHSANPKVEKSQELSSQIPPVEDKQFREQGGAVDQGHGGPMKNQGK